MIKIAEHIKGPGIMGKFYRSKGGVWLQRAGIFAPRFNVFAVLSRDVFLPPTCLPPMGGGLRRGAVVVPGINIVTDDGDLYYAQMAAAETPTEDFDGDANRMGMCGTGTAAVAKTDGGLTTPIAGSNKTQAATYPKTNDADADNTGAGTDIVTWLHSYTKADFTGTAIAEFAIGIDKDADNDIQKATTDVALMHALFASTFNKTADDTLKVFVNHTFNGV